MNRPDDMVIQDAVRRCGSPVYIFDTDALADRFSFYSDHLGKDVKINYCMKANPFLAWSSLKHAGRIEVCSYGEFLISRALEIPPERLFISGVLKKEKDMEEIISYAGEKAVYTAESAEQLDILCRIASSRGLELKVCFRTGWGQFGMDEDTIMSLLKEDRCPGISFYGIHCFNGTQKRRLRQFEKEIVALDELLVKIEETTGEKAENLEYGPGFGAEYFAGQSPVITSELLEEFQRYLDGMRWKGNIYIELGRALAYDCGCYVTEVCDIKKNGGKTFCICDGGIHQINYDGQLRGMYRPFMRTIQSQPSESTEKYVICGSLCTMNDILVQEYETKTLRGGDLLVFEHAGAYSVYEGMSLFLSHELPAICLYSEKNGLEPVRLRQESYLLNTISKEGKRY